MCILFFLVLGGTSVLKRRVEQVYDLEGDVDSVAAGGKSTRLVLELVLVVGGTVFARLLW